MYFLLCFILFIPFILSDFAYDLEKLTLTHKCDLQCTFNHSEITSKTTEFFPTNCETVCGILTFNSNTDMSPSQLKQLFKNLRTLSGGLRFENTNLTNLSVFYEKPGCKFCTDFKFNCKTFGLSVINNSVLKNADIFHKFELETDEQSKECAVRFENNTKLDARDLCEYDPFGKLFSVIFRGNSKDCGCRGDQITADSMKKLRKCSVIFTLNLTNISKFDADFLDLSRIYEVRGLVEIRGTDVTNLSFLKKLEEIRSNNGVTHENVLFNIRDNPNMTTFGMPVLNILSDETKGPFIMNLENLHPDFCLTFHEMIGFLDAQVYFKNIHANYCLDGVSFSESLCQFFNMSSLPEKCTYIYGNVEINAGDEEYVYKLSYVSDIYGSLSIKNTILKDLNFLSRLMYIALLEENRYVIQIISNPFLYKARLPMISVR
ncbi:Receptor L-domain domain-containing protein [Caenorhabditis elegans]|uniref:Receptor L-domain domain-containing protein n=1 Tax=Caenorhabditis elegans TaxID=6239 RepID=Q9U8C9_CAEEL|nr:Receptor L-domain domain-containing protein [Caenorhabditis elegans]CCD72785.1 Receptor L-domain domain-containing protein [Caenorhabditis elegans]|eukprot:NP_494407.3 Insulin/EGF-Receptor L Domain protein [Caenorhabditis elegans]